MILNNPKPANPIFMVTPFFTLNISTVKDTAVFTMEDEYEIAPKL